MPIPINVFLARTAEWTDNTVKRDIDYVRSKTCMNQHPGCVLPSPIGGRSIEHVTTVFRGPGWIEREEETSPSEAHYPATARGSTAATAAGTAVGAAAQTLLTSALGGNQGR